MIFFLDGDMSSTSNGVKIRLDLKSCRDLIKRDLTHKPLPFCRIAIDGNSTTVNTKTSAKSTTDPIFDQSFDLALGRTDSILIDVFDKNKVHKRSQNKVSIFGC